MKCKFYQEEIDKCVFDGPPDDCPYKNDLSECNCFEPKMVEYGSSDAYEEEINFTKKYCRKCSSLVCTGVGDTVAREGCKHYRHEMKEETLDNLPLIGSTTLEGAIELPKYSAKISIGDLEINLTNKTFTEEQIKNMKEMLGWEVENL